MEKVMIGKVRHLYSWNKTGYLQKFWGLKEPSEPYLNASYLIISFNIISSLLVIGWPALDLNVAWKIKCVIQVKNKELFPIE